MKTYYPLRAAAKYSGVSTRTIRRWISAGFCVDEGRIHLQSTTVDGRLCFEELHLDAFLAVRRRFLEAREQKHEKFSLD